MMGMDCRTRRLRGIKAQQIQTPCQLRRQSHPHNAAASASSKLILIASPALFGSYSPSETLSLTDLFI